MSTWWDDYKKAFLKGINPIDSIGEHISIHAGQVPGPQIPTAQPPTQWYRPGAPQAIPGAMPPPQQQAAPLEAPDEATPPPQPLSNRRSSSVPLRMLSVMNNRNQ
jgi:hypothetical protein